MDPKKLKTYTDLNESEKEQLFSYYLEKESTVMFRSQKNTGPWFLARPFYKLEKILSKLCLDT